MARWPKVALLVAAASGVVLMTAALWRSTPNVAAVAVNAMLLLLLAAACLAVGTAQPARSFFVGALVAAFGTLLFDALGPRITGGPDVFTKKLAAETADLFEPFGPTGPPGTAIYLRWRDGEQVLFYEFGDDRSPKNMGVMSQEAARERGVFDRAGPFEEWWSTDSLPDRQSFVAIHRALVTLVVGLAGGLLAYAVRRRSGRPAPTVGGR